MFLRKSQREYNRQDSFLRKTKTFLFRNTLCGIQIGIVYFNDYALGRIVRKADIACLGVGVQNRIIKGKMQ